MIPDPNYDGMTSEESDTTKRLAGSRGASPLSPLSPVGSVDGGRKKKGELLSP